VLEHTTTGAERTNLNNRNEALVVQLQGQLGVQFHDLNLWDALVDIRRRSTAGVTDGNESAVLGG
jgi:hypothetical protein